MTERALPETVGVILAAGSGTRLNHGPKPLKRVAGRALLERAVETLRLAGVGPIVVVVGHAKEEIERYVAATGLEVELVLNGDFQLGNGSSALVGGRAAGRRFLVTMADHVFEPDAVRKVLTSPAAFALAVDTRPGFCDVEEATKVRLEDGRVVAVARQLDPCDGVDAGLAVCDPEVVFAAERALAEGEGSWNAVKQRWLAEGRELAAVDLAGSPWVDVDTPAEAARAERLLVRRAARGRSDGLVSRRLNRYVSWRLSLLFLRAGFTPNAVTGIGFGLTLFAAGVLALGAESPAALVAGGLLVQLASIVDGCDGEVARASLRASLRGAFLDTVLDRVGDAALLVALALAAGGGTSAWIVLAPALVATALVPYVKASFEATFGRPLPPPAVRVRFGRDARLLVIALAGVAMQPLAGLAVVGALSLLEVANRLAPAWRASAG
ncbi:MAG: NTP transferase domain-containing protein [Thermoleophilia bacterium]|nr:NTP transferase domain-containing protein [Thermoleophilia bacterium]